MANTIGTYLEREHPVDEALGCMLPAIIGVTLLAIASFLLFELLFLL